MAQKTLREIALDYGYDTAEFEAMIAETVKTGRAKREAVRMLREEEFPSMPIPAVESLKERLARPRSPEQWRINDWLPVGGNVVLAAQFKAGKTTLVGNVVRSLVDGDKFLGVHDVTKLEGRVTILDFELSENKALEWLELQGIENADQVNLCTLRGSTSAFNILDVSKRKEWEQLLAENYTDFLILDCLRPVLDAIGLDEHRDAGKFFIAFEALLKGAGISESMVVHHMGHSGERTRGDSRMRDWPDAEWRLMRENENPASTRYITAFGRDVNVEDQRLNFNEDTHHLTLAKGKPRDKKAQAALESVLTLLSELDDPPSQKQVVKLLGHTEHARQDIVRALDRGCWQGKIETRKGNHNATLYTLSARGYITKKFGGGHGDVDAGEQHQH